MSPLLIDDVTADALLDGTAVEKRFDALAGVLDAMHALAEEPPPEPRGELARLFASPAALAEVVCGQSAGAEHDATVVPLTADRRANRLARGKRVAKAAGGLGLVAKLAFGAGAAAAAVGGAGAVGVLPAPVQEFLHDVTNIGPAPKREPIVERETDQPAVDDRSSVGTLEIDVGDVPPSTNVATTQPTTTSPRPTVSAPGTTAGSPAAPANENAGPGNNNAGGNSGNNANENAGPGNNNAGGNSANNANENAGPGNKNAGGNSGNNANENAGPGNNNAGGKGKDTSPSAE